MLWTISLACLLLALLYYYLRARLSIHRNGERLRRPRDTLPILGNAIRFLQPRQVLFDWFVQCQQHFGFETFEISVPTLPPGVVINDPKNLEFVLKNEQTITKGDFFKERSWDLFGYGIINANGELWKAQRKAGVKFFSGANLDGLIEDILPEVYAQTRSELLKHAEAGTQLDLQEIFLDLTTRVMGQIAYDMPLTSTHPFSLAFDLASSHIGLRFQNPLYPLLELPIFPTGRRLARALAEVKAFGRTIMRAARKRRARTAFDSLINDEVPVLDTLVDALIDAFDGNATIVADAALNFLSAGRDTTAQALTWVFYLLMRNPEAGDFIGPEVDALFSETRAARFSPFSAPRLTALFYESLRLYPPVPFEIKQCTHSTTLPDGTFLPAGAVVVWCIWALNRSRTTFGPDADVFRPARWIDTDADGNAKLVAKTAFEFPVFNGGPRACLGRKMAELMGVWVIGRVAGEFVFEEAGQGHGMGKGVLRERETQNSLTLPMKGGLPCRVRLRERG